MEKIPESDSGKKGTPRTTQPRVRSGSRREAQEAVCDSHRHSELAGVTRSPRHSQGRGFAKESDRSGRRKVGVTPRDTDHHGRGHTFSCCGQA